MNKLPEEIRKHFSMAQFFDKRYRHCSHCDGYGYVLRDDEKLTNCHHCSHTGLEWTCPECKATVGGTGFLHLDYNCMIKTDTKKKETMLEKAREEGRLFPLEEQFLKGHRFLYSSQVGYNEGFIDIDDLDWVLDDLEPGTYFFTSCSAFHPHLDACDTITSLIEDSWEGAEVPEKEYDDLQDYYDKMCQRLNNLTSYSPNWKIFFEVTLDARD